MRDLGLEIFTRAQSSGWLGSLSGTADLSCIQRGAGDQKRKRLTGREME
jgi:hypothetical protein